jgi:hypothetical protein
MDHQAFAQLLGNYGEFVGAIAVVVTLFYLAVQVRHSKDATEANTRSLDQSRELALIEAGFNFAQSRRDLQNTIIENADIWTRGNSGESLDRVEAEIYSELVLKKWDIAFWTDFALNRLQPVQHVGKHDFAAFLHRYPCARTTWEAGIRMEQDYRNRLLDEPRVAGVDDIQIVLDDLEKLSKD